MSALTFHEAEQATLGALLTAPELVRRVPWLRPEHFADPKHRLVMAAVLDSLADTAGVVDELTILETLQRGGGLAQVGGGPYLHTLVESCPVTANVQFYAGLVAESAQRRGIAEMGARLQQAAAANDFQTAADVALGVRDMLGELVTPADRSDDVEGLSEMGAFVDVVDDEHQWVIPGLLERMDRVVLVASEGAGKSTLGRMVAAMVGQGLHPFAPDVRIPPKRTLIVDLENPPSLVRRKTRFLVDELRREGNWIPGQTHLLMRPGGINLRKPVDVAMLERVVSEVRPQLICLGPLYKAALDGGDKGEQVAGDVAFALDRIRERHRVALWLEAHAPLEQMGQRTLRPFGSGLWSRWPEFGIAMYRDQDFASNKTVHLRRFRGDRDERSWPISLRWGRQWPWDPIWDEDVPPPVPSANWDAPA